MAKLVEDTAHATRKLPIAKKLREILVAAADDAGIDLVRVISGGQPKKGQPGSRVGSTRHDEGNAADLELEVAGKKLSFLVPEQLSYFENFVSAAAKRGATGLGAGKTYMGEHRIHVGFGKQLVWGAGGKSANAPAWLKAAAARGWAAAKA
jgi:hypothetical protein